MSEKRKRSDEKVLVAPWRNVHAAIWLIGLAILAWKDWWWPGILVLVALSILAEAVIKQIPGATAPKVEGEIETGGGAYVKGDVEVAEGDFIGRDKIDLQEPDSTKLPEKCQECGAPVPADEVKWTSATTAGCPYCGANLRMRA